MLLYARYWVVKTSGGQPSGLFARIGGGRVRLPERSVRHRGMSSGMFLDRERIESKKDCSEGEASWRLIFPEVESEGGASLSNGRGGGLQGVLVGARHEERFETWVKPLDGMLPVDGQAGVQRKRIHLKTGPVGKSDARRGAMIYFCLSGWDYRNAVRAMGLAGRTLMPEECVLIVVDRGRRI